MVLEDGATDQPEIFTIDTALKITKYVFEEKKFNEDFGGVLGGDLVFERTAPAHITTPLKVYPIDLKIFLEVLQAISQR